jgi:hypothetical protein
MAALFLQSFHACIFIFKRILRIFIFKRKAIISKHKQVKKSPILFGGTCVQDGQGKMVVLAVGTGSYQGS